MVECKVFEKKNIIGKTLGYQTPREYNQQTVILNWLSAESEKPRQPVSNADRKVFANPESFCDKFIFG